jgi:hypothetical protein
MRAPFDNQVLPSQQDHIQVTPFAKTNSGLQQDLENLVLRRKYDAPWKLKTVQPIMNRVADWLSSKGGSDDDRSPVGYRI